MTGSVAFERMLVCLAAAGDMAQGCSADGASAGGLVVGGGGEEVEDVEDAGEVEDEAAEVGVRAQLALRQLRAAVRQERRRALQPHLLPPIPFCPLAQQANSQYE